MLPAGRKELKCWVAEHDEPKTVRDALMVRLRAEAALGPSGLESEIRQQIEREQSKLALYQEIEARDFSGPADTREAMLQHLVLKSGIRAVSMRIELAREALDILAMPPSNTGSRGGPP